jgi:hypothetical protein
LLTGHAYTRASIATIELWAATWQKRNPPATELPGDTNKEGKTARDFKKEDRVGGTARDFKIPRNLGPDLQSGYKANVIALFVSGAAGGRHPAQAKSGDFA